MSYTTIPAAGAKLRGSTLNSLITELRTADPWTDYSPSLAWTSSGTAPVLGNAVVVARYIQTGKLTIYTFRITFGTTSTYGTGTYSFSLPVNSQASRYAVGSAYCRDASAGSAGHFPATAVVDTTVSASTLFVINVNALVGQTFPFTWTTSDYITATVAYESV